MGSSTSSSIPSPSPQTIAITPSKSQIQNIINNGEIIPSFTTTTNQPQQQQQFNPRENHQSNLFDNFTTGGEGKGLENILETLEMLKHTRQ